jgi:2'-5' RNA ligase
MLFIALDIPGVNDQNEPIQFANSQLLISQAVPGFRPVTKLHATILFLGSLNDEQTGQVKIALKRATQEFINQHKRGLTNGIAGFMIYPGVAVMGKNAVALKLVDNALVNELLSTVLRVFKEYGINPEGPHENFDLHVTIGRIPPTLKSDYETQRFLEQLPAPIGGRAQLKETFTVSTLSLYKSLPGSEYTVIESYKI